MSFNTLMGPVHLYGLCPIASYAFSKREVTTRFCTQLGGIMLICDIISQVLRILLYQSTLLLHFLSTGRAVCWF
jgi:hypothetical protein